MLAHGHIERVALADRIVDRNASLLEFRILGRFAEDLQRLEHRHAVGQQIRKLRAKVSDLIFLDANRQLDRNRLGSRCRVLDAHREHRLSPQFLHRFGARAGRNHAREFFSGARFCGVSEVGHQGLPGIILRKMIGGLWGRTRWI